MLRVAELGRKGSWEPEHGLRAPSTVPKVPEGDLPPSTKSSHHANDSVRGLTLTDRPLFAYVARCPFYGSLGRSPSVRMPDVGGLTADLMRAATEGMAGSGTRAGRPGEEAADRGPGQGRVGQLLDRRCPASPPPTSLARRRPGSFSSGEQRAALRVRCTRRWPGSGGGSWVHTGSLQQSCCGAASVDKDAGPVGV